MDRLFRFGLLVVCGGMLALPSLAGLAGEAGEASYRATRVDRQAAAKKAKVEARRERKRDSQQAAELAAMMRNMVQLQVADGPARATAAHALGLKGLSSHPAIEPLVRCLDDERDYVRVAAEWAIARIAHLVTLNAGKLTPDEQQECLRQFRLARKVLDQRASSYECRRRVGTAEEKLAAIVPAGPPVTFGPSTEFANVRSGSESSEPSPEPLLEQLQRAIHAGAQVEICRLVLALKRTGEPGLKPLLTALEQSQEYSAVEDLLLGSVSSYGPEVLPHLRAWLQINTEVSSDLEIRQRSLALRCLQNLGPNGSQLLPELIQLLRREHDPLELRNLILTLTGMKEQAAPAAAELLAVLNRSQELLLSHDIVSALKSISATDPGTLDAVTQLVRDEAQPFELRRAAAEFLLPYRAVPAEWTQLLIPRLISQLEHDDDATRQEAAESLAVYGPTAAAARTGLLKRVRDESSPETFQAVCRAIRAIGPEAIDELISGLHSFDEATRHGTYRAIAELGSVAGAARLVLIERSMNAEGDAERAAAIRCLGKLGFVAFSEIDQFVAWTADRRQPLVVRHASAAALGELGSIPAEAAQLLVAVLNDASEPEPLRVTVAETLAHLGDEQARALRAMIQESEVSNSTLAVTAACGLVRLGSFDDAVIRILLENMDDERLGGKARLALSQLTAGTIPTLEQIAADRSGSDTLRQNAVIVLGQLDEAAMDSLIRLLGKDALVSDQAANVLSGFSWRVMPRLMELLADPDATPARPKDRELRRHAEMVIAELFLGGFGYGGPSEPAGAAPDFAHGSDAEPRATQPGAPSTPGRLETVKVFFGTNRKALSSESERQLAMIVAFLPAIISLILTLTFLVVLSLFARRRWVVGVACSGLLLTAVLSIPATRHVLQLERATATRPGPVYGPQNMNRIELGSCEVTIPALHAYGELESPKLLSLEFRQDPSKHIVVKSVTSHSAATFYQDLHENLSQRGSGLLVFIHGFNVEFDDAARRTAQMAHDLKFPGAPVFFSWPSQGNWQQYRADEQQVELSIAAVKQFLLDLARSSGAKSIHLVAHSMGTRALSGALQEIQTQFPDRQPMFHQVVLAAPDIDAEIFRNQIAPAIVGSAQRVTLYASSNDLALKASRTFNAGSLRAGDSRDPVVVSGIETIDVSQVDTSLLGHSYYGSNPTVLTDLRELLATARPAELRPGLEAIVDNYRRYWKFRDRRLARQPFSPNVR